MNVHYLCIFPTNVFPSNPKLDNRECGMNTEDTNRVRRLCCPQRLTVGANCPLLLLWAGLRELESSIQVQHPAQQARRPHFGGGDENSMPFAGDPKQRKKSGREAGREQ